MNCEKFRELLDAYIDNMLNDEELREFMNHADSCEECGDELRAAEMLRDIMKDMDDEVAVPLQAQAAWRNAVRAESKKIRMRKFARIGYAAAAALVLFFGVNFMIGENVNDSVMPNAVQMKAGMELVARDGSAEAVSADQAEPCSAMKKIETNDYDRACMTIEQLCGEYSGKFTAESAQTEGKNEVSYRIELPYEYMADFLSAADHIGTEIASETDEAEREIAVILIQIREK